MTIERNDAALGAEPLESAAQNRAEGAIDMKLLAEKVYRLWQADLRLEQARTGATRRKRQP